MCDGRSFTDYNVDRPLAVAIKLHRMITELIVPDSSLLGAKAVYGALETLAFELTAESQEKERDQRDNKNQLTTRQRPLASGCQDVCQLCSAVGQKRNASEEYRPVVVAQSLKEKAISGVQAEAIANYLSFGLRGISSWRNLDAAVKEQCREQEQHDYQPLKGSTIALTVV